VKISSVDRATKYDWTRFMDKYNHCRDGRTSLVVISLKVPFGYLIYDTFCSFSVGCINFKTKVFWLQLASNWALTSADNSFLTEELTGDGRKPFCWTSFFAYVFASILAGFDSTTGWRDWVFAGSWGFSYYFALYWILLGFFFSGGGGVFCWGWEG